MILAILTYAITKNEKLANNLIQLQKSKFKEALWEDPEQQESEIINKLTLQKQSLIDLTRFFEKKGALLKQLS